MMWLAMKVFGNGYGMSAPYWSQNFYWLVDEATKQGRFYTWIGGFGAQLRSFEWKMPKPGTRRRVAGIEIEVFGVSRGRWPIMWDVAWALVRLPPDIDGQNATINAFKEKIEKGYYT